MARFKKLKQLRSLGVILDSGEMESFVSGVAAGVLAGVSDPNPEFMGSLRMGTFHTRSARGVKRVVAQVGAAPGVGEAVEAARGPLARALRGAS